MKRILGLVTVLALLLPMLSAPAHAIAAVPPDMAAIDSYVAQQLRTLRIPGAALGIVHGDRIVHLQDFGAADASGRPMTAQTPSLIGSLTKSFTAVAIMQLVEQGAVELDAPVQRYLPSFRVSDAGAASRITVRQLLTHSSGLPGGDDTASMARDDTAADALERQVGALATVELAHPVGSTWEYANANYTILGLVVETVSGQSYEEYVQQHIFAPLKMEQSFASPVVAQQHGLAAGHKYWFGQPRPTTLPYPRGLLPAGFLVSSAADMSRYLLAHLNGGQSGEWRILSPDGVAELHNPTISLGEPGAWSGMGWGVIDADGVRVLQHDGNAGNYRADMYLLPESGWGFVLLMNASDAFQQSATRNIGRGIATLLLGQEPQAVARNPLAQLVYGAILAVVWLELLGVVLSIRTLWRWRAAPPRRALGRHVLLPLAGNVLVGVLLLVVVPAALFGGSLSGAVFTAPDLGYTLLLVGWLALGWGLLRTLLALRLLVRPIAVSAHAAPAHAQEPAVR